MITEKLQTEKMNKYSFSVIPTLLLVCALGCSGGKIPTYRFDGTVTYNGQPIPAGAVIMTPSKGNKGPEVHLSVDDGKFDSVLPANGPVAGSHRIRIAGYHDFQTIQGPEGPESIGQEIFPTHEEDFDMPKKKTTHHFDIKGPPVEIKR